MKHLPSLNDQIVEIIEKYNLIVDNTITDSSAKKEYKTVKFMVNDLDLLESSFLNIKHDILQLCPNSNPRLSRYDKKKPFTMLYAGLRVNLPKRKN